jgi:hypothetical protein
MAAASSRRSFRTAILLASAGLVAFSAVLASTPWARGYAIYHGYLSLPGRIAGHDSDLPSRAARCSNCHEALSGNGTTARLITPLTRDSLGAEMARRNGPPSKYDTAAFCTAMRDGIDPAMIQLERTMPRFAPTDSDCVSLWSYVNSR